MNKQQIQDLPDPEIESLFEQYNEMESRSLLDEVILDLLAMEKDMRAL